MYRRKVIYCICLFMVIALCIPAAQLSAWGAGDVKDRIGKAIVLYIGCSNAIAKNTITKVDTQNKEVAPLVKDGRTLVPVRFVAENFGAGIGWDGATSTVTITQGDKIIKLVLGSNIMRVNGEEKMLDVPAESIGGRTFIPLRALTNILGKNLFWDDRGLIVISEEENIFDRDREKALIDDTITLVTGKAVKLSNKDERISMMVDPRIELIAVIEILSGFGDKYKDSLTNLDFTYKKKVNDYFAPYKDHEAVKQFTEVSNRKFIYWVPLTMMLNFSEPPELKVIRKADENILTMTGGYSQLDNFNKSLADFAEKSNFSKFYYDNFSFYKQIVTELYKVSGGMYHLEAMENYFGKKQNNYNFILTPLQKGGYKTWESNGNLLDYYQVFGPIKIASDIPVFVDENGFEVMIWENVNFPFINPIVRKYAKDIDKYTSLFKPVEEKMKKYEINTWLSCAEANISSAIIAKLEKQQYTNASSEYFLDYYDKNGFIYVKALAKKLDEYEINRDKYPTFDSFFPKLLEAFNEASSKQ